MKKLSPTLCLILALYLVFLTSCGTREETVAPQISKYTIIEKEEERIPEPEGKTADWRLLGRQFIQGSAVQIWGVKAGSLMDVYLYREDGSSEQLVAGASMDYVGNWYLDSEGCIYIFGPDLLIRLDKEGNEFYQRKGNDIMDLCQMQDGRVMVVVQEENRSFSLAELEPSTGGLKEKAGLGDTTCYIGGGEHGLLLMDSDGIWELGIEDGGRESVLPFRGTYDPGTAASDFLVQEDGTALVLQKGGNLQTLRLCDLAEGKEVIVIRLFSSYALKDYIEMFNRQNTEYYIATEEMEVQTFSSTALSKSISEFMEETALQIVAGKGADIILDGIIANPADMMEIGAFEDLAPYMERDGIRKEDYFPVAFGWQEGGSIYGVTVCTGLSDLWINAELLEGNEAGEIGKLVEALLDYKEDAVFMERVGSESILNYFLAGSESLWGMVDWEEGMCDFSGELFAGILEVADRYGYDETRQDVPALANRLTGTECSFYGYDYYAAQEEAQGRVHMGYLFENGNSADVLNTLTMAISSTSAHKEGAWAFIRFLLSEEVQAGVTQGDQSMYPVSKTGFDQCGAHAIAQGSIVEQDGKTSYKGITGSVKDFISALGRDGYKEAFDPTEERVARIKAVLETIEPSDSFRTVKIISIIAEEAGAYFAGDKSIEEVSAIIQNRVQLYMDEHN